MRNRNLIFLGATSASAVLLLAVGAGPANATEEHEVGLHQQTPITADDPEFAHDTCPTIPADQDGWHFVLPGGKTTFVELRVTFEDGGEQVITSFGPPTDKHAYVASEPGDTLIAASATVEGDDVDFRLSHTCPASEDEEETVGGTTSGGTTGGEEATTGETTTGGEETTTGETTTGGEETTTGETTTGGEETTTGETTTGGEETTTGETTTGGEDGEDPVSDEETTDDGTDLAETGSSTSVITIAAGGAALLGAGAYLALRRRRTARH